MEDSFVPRTVKVEVIWRHLLPVLVPELQVGNDNFTSSMNAIVKGDINTSWPNHFVNGFSDSVAVCATQILFDPVSSRG